MKLSVVIPSNDLPQRLDLVLSQIFQAASMQEVECILVIDQARLSTRLAARKNQVASSFPLTKICLNKNGPKGAYVCRHLGVANASGEIVVFLDDDTVPTDEYFSLVERVMTLNLNVDGVTGPIVETASDVFGELRKVGYQLRYKKHLSPLYQQQLKRRYGLREGLYSPYVSGGNFVIRAAAYKKFGGYEPVPGIGQDRIFGQRIFDKGGSLLFAQDLSVGHENQGGCVQLVKGRFQSGIRSTEEKNSTSRWDAELFRSLGRSHGLVGRIVVTLHYGAFVAGRVFSQMRRKSIFLNSRES